MKQIKLFKPYMSWRAMWNVIPVLCSDYLGEGPQVKALEQEFGEMFNLKNVIALNSGTAALELAYDLVAIQAGDEVITPVFTAPATNIPLARRGAKLVFADLEDDLNVSVADVKQKITAHTKAVVFVHVNGNNRGLDEIRALCAEKKIPFIEDAAQAVGSEHWGTSDFVCTSFQAIKTFTTGDGGALVVKDPELAAKARRLRWFGFDREKGQTASLINEAGYKFQMNDIIAAIGRGNLRAMPKVIAHRRRLVEEYRRGGIPAHIWCAFVLSDRRTEIRERLAAEGIHAEVYNNRNDLHPIFGGRRQPLPKMDAIEHQYLFLPLHMGMSIADVQRISSIIAPFLSEKSNLL